MPWCPKCGTEHREGFTICQDCRVPLVSTPPEKKEENFDDVEVRETLLTVVADDVEFTRIESLMAEAGIPVLKKHRGSGEYLELYMGISPYGIEIYVPYDALARGKALLSGDESLPEAVLDLSIAVNEGQPEEIMEPLLEPHEERELQSYIHAVNQDMLQRKKAIAMMILLSMAAGLIWSVYSILMELF